MFRNRNFSDERRTNLFSERPFIYGRLPKYLLCFMFCMNLWSGYYLHHRQGNSIHNRDKTKRCYRKVIPFVQAMEDIKYVSLEQRNYMILKAICDYNGDSQTFDFLRTRYYQNDQFNYAVKGYTLRQGIDGRFGTARYQNIKVWRKPEDEDGLVGFQEVSKYS